jgi:DHA2 family metal-tetracycline-proton antiporter-like MFS transporter
MEPAVNREKLKPWIIYLLFFAVLNETVFNVSTPKIAEQFGLTPAGVSWMMTLFMVFFGIGSVIFGKLSDLYPLRRLVVIGILIYNLGSVLGFFLQSSYPLVILCRGIQGIGASAMPALVFTAAARYFPASERGKVFGSLTSTVSLAIGIGPVLGGFVSESLHWADLFLIPLLILVSIPYFLKELPPEPPREGSLDLPGAILVALTVGALVVCLNFPRWIYLGAFLVFLTLFLLWIHRAPEPFIPPDLFKNARFRDGVIVGFLLFSVVLGVMFLVPLMLHEVHGLGTRDIGLVLFPGAISSVFFGPLAGSLADRKGNSFVVALGLTLLVSGMALMAMELGASFYIVGACMLFVYVGFSLFQTAMINSVSQTLTEKETGIGMGVFNLVGILSGAVGTAIVGKILAGRWMDFAFLPTLSKGYAYGNLMLIFSAIVLLGGALYLQSYRQTEPARPLGEKASEA